MDKKYWEDYYHRSGKNIEISERSTFSEFCSKNYFHKKELKIIELGCGNGRDAIYFAHNNHTVIAIDQCTNLIEDKKQQMQNSFHSNLIPLSQDFIRYDYSLHIPIDVFYSRFTLHSIDEKDEEILLPNIYNSLEVNGLFCVEARTIKDPIFGIGEECGDNAYRTDHYRRFLDSKLFLKKILKLGFELLFFTEQNNLSIYQDDNPVLMRIILRKI
jgi:tellurite methyltransferase